MASRHLARALVLQTLFECDMMGALDAVPSKEILTRNASEFELGASDVAFAEGLVAGILAKKTEIDELIVKAAPQWPLDKIAPIDRNVLRIGLYELLFGDRSAVPPKVALNEAIEIAKSFGGDASGKFVNGVLGAVYREIGEPQKDDAPKREVSAQENLGGVVLVVTEGGATHVALVHDAFHRWTLPKAKCVEGEISRLAAERAITDELGVPAVIVEPLVEHTYTAHDPTLGTVERTVAYFLATLPKTDALVCRVCEGVTDAQWFTTDQLAGLQIYDDLRGIIEKGIVRAEKGI